MKIRKIVIFGLNDMGQLARYYFSHDSSLEVSGFTVDKAYKKDNDFEGLPVVEFEAIEKTFPPEEFGIFIAVGYSGLNKLRTEKYVEAKKKGYETVSYISSKATIFPNVKIGQNCFVLEANTLQPFVEIGNNVVLWSGNHVGHHSIIGDHCFISSHVVISGRVHIKESCFVGINASIRNGLTIEKRTMIGPGVAITKNTKPDETYIVHQVKPLPKKNALLSL